MNEMHHLAMASKFIMDGDSFPTTILWRRPDKRKPWALLIIVFPVLHDDGHLWERDI